jgi:PAS domain S-box-containing protein
MTSGERVMPVPAQPRELAAFLSDVNRRFGPTLDLSEILAETTRAVVELLGFGLAVLNLVTPEGPLEVVAVEGPEDARRVLLGSSSTRDEWDLLLSDAGASGALRFVPYDSPALAGEINGITRWVPSQPSSPGDTWHPGDELFAPLYAADGELLGVLSVDLPPHGRRPDARVLELLELFAVQAALALDHARLHARLRRSEALLRRTFEQAPVGMAVFGSDERLQQANPAYCAFLGLPLEELVGRQISEFSQADDSDEVDYVGRSVRELGDEVVRLERRHVRPDGSVRWGRLTLTNLDPRARPARGRDRHPPGGAGARAAGPHRPSHRAGQPADRARAPDPAAERFGADRGPLLRRGQLQARQRHARARRR